MIMKHFMTEKELEEWIDNNPSCYNHYVKILNAMTDEKLESKSQIAWEIAKRDILLKRQEGLI